MNKRVTALVLTILMLSLMTSTPKAEVEVTVYLDRESAGWAYKKSDYAFVAEREGCRIKWNAVEYKEGGKSLEVRRDCRENFDGQVDFHKEILTAINQRWSLASFDYIYWGSLCSGDDWSWCRPIARASLNSADYIDYWRNYPNSRLKEINTLFVRLANETHSYAALSDLFDEFDIKIRLGSVEKVFAMRLNESPFRNEFDDLARGGNPKVMYNVGMAYFYIGEHGGEGTEQ